jgi:signal transduction histidine kinase
MFGTTMEESRQHGGEREAARGIPLAAMAVSILVGAAATLAFLLGSFYYRDAVGQERARLRSFSAKLADQVAATISQPIWNLDLEQARRILMSAMSAREIEEIYLLTPDLPGQSIGFLRNSRTGISTTREEPSPDLMRSRGLSLVERQVTWNGAMIAAVRLYVTEESQLLDLRRTMRVYTWAMIAYCMVLSGCQFLLLWLLVIRPIRAVNAYASTVIGGGGGDRRLPLVRRMFPREIGVLGESITVMVGRLRERFDQARASEERARESESRYRAIFQGSPVSLWEEDISELRAELSRLREEGVTDMGRYLEEHDEIVRRAVGLIRVVDVNDATLRLYGAQRREQLLGPLDLTLDPGALADFRRQVVAVAEGRRLWEHETTARALDGRVLHILASFAIPAPHDARQSMLVNVFDVSARLEIERALRDSELRYRTFIENSSDGIVRWELAEPVPVTLPEDEQVRRIYRSAYVAECNDSAAAIYGVPRAADFLGRSLERSAPQSQPTQEEVLHGFIRAGYQLAGAEPMPAGHEVPVVRLSLTGVVEDGRLIRVWGVLQNIAAVRRAELEKRALEERLQQAQKMEAIGQLAGGVAHDFNNILAALTMNIDLMQEKPNLDAGTRESLREMMADASRAAALTRQLLMFSRRSVLSIRVIELNDVVSNLLKMLGRLLGENVVIDFEQRGSLPSIEADAGMIEQVIMNLAVNARDAMPGGGRITLATAAVEIDQQAAALNPARRPGRFVCLSVSDTGQGMDEPTLARIFEPFFTTKPEGKGTGLGLATVYGIVAQHKGWVEVESRVGGGTTFRVHFPPSDKPQADGAEGRLRRAPRGKESLLVVEDDPSVRLFAVKALAALGYRVFEAANGQEALGVWERHGAEIALVLTDMVMPEGMTGLELARRLRASSPGLKIVISSGYSMELASLGSPADAGIAYLPKPYKMSVLGETMRRCLDGGLPG